MCTVEQIMCFIVYPFVHHSMLHSVVMRRICFRSILKIQLLHLLQVKAMLSSATDIDAIIQAVPELIDPGVFGPGFATVQSFGWLQLT